MTESKPKTSRKKNQSNEMRCRQRLATLKQLVQTGNILCVDPSSASESSKPGWARFIAGQLVEAGIIDVPSRLDLRVRLRRIHEQLQLLIPGTDLVLIEEVPVRPIRTQMSAAATGKTWMNAKSHGSLIQAVGMTKAAFPESLCQIDIPATLWHRISREQNWGMDGSAVLKNDTLDAVRIGMAAIHITTPKAEIP